MKSRIVGIAALILLVGCSAPRDHRLHTEAYKACIQASAMVEVARWNVLAELAKSDDVTSKVAAAMAAQSTGKNSDTNNIKCQ